MTVLRSFLRNILRPSVVVILLSIGLPACATFPAGGGTEPPTIVIRNRSGADIATVTLREAGPGAGQPRFASLAPVPTGASPQVGRSSDPPPFPRAVVLEWVDAAGRTVVRELSLLPALKDATGAKDEALVFEIGPFEDVLVFIERGPR